MALHRWQRVRDRVPEVLLSGKRICKSRKEYRKGVRRALGADLARRFMPGMMLHLFDPDAVESVRSSARDGGRSSFSTSASSSGAQLRTSASGARRESDVHVRDGYLPLGETERAEASPRTTAQQLPMFGAASGLNAEPNVDADGGERAADTDADESRFDQTAVRRREPPCWPAWTWHEDVLLSLMPWVLSCFQSMCVQPARSVDFWQTS